MNIPAGFDKEALRYVADALETESKTVEVNNGTDYPCHPESAPAQAARFIRAVIADAPKSPVHSIAPEPFHAESPPDQEDQSMDWWQDAIKNALGAAHEHYQEQAENASTLQTQNSEREMWQLTSERDNASEWADKLAHAIVERLGVGIDELSNASNPWQKALDYCQMPAQENQWQQAVLNECVAIEGCYAEADPVGTVKRLIDWYVRNTTNGTKPAQEINPHGRMTEHVTSHNGFNVDDKLRKAAEEVVNLLNMEVNEEQLVAGLKLLEGAIENLREALEGKS